MLYDHCTNFEYHIDHHDYTCYCYKEPMIVVCSSEQFNMALSPSKYCVLNGSEKITLIGTSEWLMFNEQCFSYIMARASCIRLDDNNIRFLLDQHAQLDFIVLAHITNSLLVDMSFHSSTLFWFRAGQALFLLLIALCLWKMLQIPNA